MMGGTVTVVIHIALSTVTVAVVLGALVDTITGTDVVISVQMGIRNEIHYSYHWHNAKHSRHEHFSLRVSVRTPRCLSG